MEEGETVSIPSRKELRKKKLMEYLATKGKLKLPNPKAYLRDDYPIKKPIVSATMVVKGKENKVPSGKVRYDGTKVKSLTAQSTKDSARREFGVTNKVNVNLSGQQNAKFPSTTRAAAQPSLNQNPLLRSTYTVVSSNSILNAATHFKKQSNTTKRASCQTSSNVSHTAVITSNNRFNSSTKAALSVPVNSASVRMSLGPMVKTRTGLVPAITQPRNSTLHLTHNSATAPNVTTSVTNKVVSRTTSSLSVSQRSAVVQRKIVSTTAVNNPVNERKATLTARPQRSTVQDKNKTNLKPLLIKHSQPPCKNQLLSGQKSTSVSSKCKAAPIKPERKVVMSKTNLSAGQPTDRSTKQRSEDNCDQINSVCKAISQLSLRPSERVTRAAVVEQGDKTTKYKEIQSRRGCGSAHLPAQQTNKKRTSVPVMSKTKPQPPRTISFTAKSADMKTPKVPVRVISQTEGKRQTSAREERMLKLQKWRDAKGISYKRPPMSVKPQVRRTMAVPQPFWSAMKEEDDAQTLICAVDHSLADCIKLLRDGCPPDQIKEVLERLPVVSQKFAKYWICKARLMEQEGNLDVLPMFKEAVRVVLEPVDELRTVVFEILKKKDEVQESEENEKDEHQTPAYDNTDEGCNNPVMTPKPTRALIRGERRDSSVVKYKITATPGGPQGQQREPVRVNGQEVRFFTPVRRSVRIERASLRYPASLQDHDVCVASYNDLISEEEKGGDSTLSVNDAPMYVYRENEALKDKVFVQLVYDEGV